MKKRANHISCTTCTSRLKSVFCEITTEDIFHVNHYKSRFTYPKGGVIYHRATLPLGVFVIESGKVKITHPNGDGRDQIVRLAGEGDLIGHRALLSNLPHLTTAIAIEETHVCFLSRELFMRLYANNNSVPSQLILLLSHNLATAEQQITSVSYKTVKSRIAESLLYLRDKFGCEKETNVLNLTLSRQDLSSLAGTATETLIRNLIRLKEDGLIGLKGKKIQLLDLKGLQAVARSHS